MIDFAGKDDEGRPLLEGEIAFWMKLVIETDLNVFKR
jgi:hypothetical protein